MDLSQKTKRKEARRLFLTGECDTNAEIARRLGLKPHTVGRYRKEEDWDGLKLKADRRAAEKMVEQIATEKVSLNVRHYRYWDVLLNEIAVTLKAGTGTFKTRELVEMAGILEKAQKGQRVAKGLMLTGEAEEAIRAQAEAETRQLIDLFVDTIKETVPDEDTREQIRRRLLAEIPRAEDDGVRDNPDAGLH